MSMEIRGPASMEADGVYENVVVTQIRDGDETQVFGCTVTITTDEHGARHFDVVPPNVAHVPLLRDLGAPGAHGPIDSD